MRNENLSVILAILLGAIFSIFLLFGALPDDEKEEMQPQEPQTIDIVRVSTLQTEKPNLTSSSSEPIVVEPLVAKSINIQEEDEAVTTVKAQEGESVTFIQSQGNDDFVTRCKLTYAESGLEESVGQVAVAATIINRQESENFPDSLYGVMTQSGAFSSVRNGEIYIMTSNPYVLDYADVPDRTIEATQKALDGEDPTESLLWDEAVRLGLDPEVYAAGGALFFYNPNACSDAALQERANIQCKVQIGNHIFYKVWG